MTQLFIIVNFLIITALAVGAYVGYRGRHPYEGSLLFNICAIAFGAWCTAVGAVYVLIALYRFAEAVIRITLQ